MTTLPREMTFAACGARSTQTVVMSASAFGASDLDTRPPEMMRSALRYQVQECPRCGYCAQDISIPESGISALLSGPEYGVQRRNPAFPELANRFLCSAMVCKALEKYAKAGWAAVQAAWACDDNRNEAAATKCRERALDLSEKAVQAKQPFTCSPATGLGIIADLRRRSGQFEQALRIARGGAPTIPGEDPAEHLALRSIFAFESALAARRDRSCYTVDDSMKFCSSY